MTQENTYQHQIRVYAEDVDYMGIVYHANHLCYLERARTEFLRQKNLLLSDLEKLDTLFAVREINIRYLAPARLDDLLTITSVVSRPGACIFLFEQEMKNQEDTLICKAQIQIVSVNKNLKPKRYPY